jgi:hypothetical protein
MTAWRNARRHRVDAGATNLITTALSTTGFPALTPALYLRFAISLALLTAFFRHSCLDVGFVGMGRKARATAGALRHVIRDELCDVRYALACGHPTQSVKRKA